MSPRLQTAQLSSLCLRRIVQSLHRSWGRCRLLNWVLPAVARRQRYPLNTWHGNMTQCIMIQSTNICGKFLSPCSGTKWRQ